MYCECYAKQLDCNPDCRCCDCHNTPHFDAERVKARRDTLKRNNHAFTSTDVKVIKCKCKRAECLKNYCDCFNNNRRCTSACACFNCKNGNPNTTKDESLLNTGSGRKASRSPVTKPAESPAPPPRLDSFITPIAHDDHDHGHHVHDHLWGQLGQPRGSWRVTCRNYLKYYIA